MLRNTFSPRFAFKRTPVYWSKIVKWTKTTNFGSNAHGSHRVDSIKIGAKRVILN